MRTTNFFWFSFSYAITVRLPREKQNNVYSQKPAISVSINKYTLSACIVFFLCSQRDWDKRIKNCHQLENEKKNYVCAFGLVHFKCSIHRFPFKIRRWVTFSEIFLWKFYHLQYSWTRMQLTTTTWLQPHCSVFNLKSWCQTESSFVLLSKSLTHRFWHCSQKSRHYKNIKRNPDFRNQWTSTRGK